MLSKLEETLIVGDDRYELGANRYPGAIHPQGFHYLREFRLDPCPVFVYEAGGVRVEKRVYMVHGENTTVIEYTVTGTRPSLEIRPLIAFRDYHSTTHQNDALQPAVVDRGGVVMLTPMPECLLCTWHTGARRRTGPWLVSEFRIRPGTRARPGFPGGSVQPAGVHASRARGGLYASTEPQRTDAEGRRAALRSTNATLVSELTRAAAQFIVRRGNGKTVIAGYHWFSDWGRDTMIALPGLTLATGRYDVARQILRRVRAGDGSRACCPTVFPTTARRPNTTRSMPPSGSSKRCAPTSTYTGDFDFVRDRLYAVLKESIDWHLRGTRYGIRVDADGLLACGEPGVQLTWMDAKVGDWVVTPRHGKPVEIQALWYNALRVMEELAGRFTTRPSQD